MSRGAWIVVAASGLILAVFGAGFVRGSPVALDYRPQPCAPPRVAMEAPADHRDSARGKVAWSTAQQAGLLALTSSPNYKRAADFSLKVEDCTKAEDLLESKLEAIKGEILDMLMEGTEGSRTCTLTVLIPADTFRGFIADLRKMGKVQAEKITASKLKPGEARGETKESPDPRELSLVSIRMADEKVAQTVLESRGLLASSFDRSASHFMDGLSVLVEALGYFLPYFIVLAALLVPVAVIRRSRRANC